MVSVIKGNVRYENGDPEVMRGGSLLNEAPFMYRLE
jgi:hypothetical protein